MMNAITVGKMIFALPVMPCHSALPRFANPN